MEYKQPSGLVVITDSHVHEERPLNCGVCGASFRKDQMGAYDRHVYRCAHSDRAQDMEAMSMRRRIPMFDPKQHGDVEYDEWLRRNRKALIEGRMKM